MSCIPAKEKKIRRHHCCHIPKTRRKSPIHECSMDTATFRQREKMLHEFLEDYAYTWNDRGTCRCQESSTHGSGPAAELLHPLFGFLRRRYENDMSGLYRDLECPIDLLHSLFLKLESAQRWHRLIMVVPWLQDLLEASHTCWVPRPQEMCVSCRKWQTTGSVTGMSKRKHKSPRRCSPSREWQRFQPNLQSLSESHSNTFQTADQDLTEEGVCERGMEENLKSSLKKDLEKHQLYLTHIESRLSSLEHRADSVTRHLERANLELEAIKKGSVPLQKLVDQMFPVTEDLKDWDLQVLDSLLEDVLWNGDPLQTQRPSCDPILRPDDPHRTGDSSHKPNQSPPRRIEQRSNAEAGIFHCQNQINVLLQQISQQIDQTEMDLKIAINQAYRG
ncbi:uncharacterized protein [Pyxicephalus adspersus]|uniref:uncharacterized protein isoform X2 n=1 Tax=Pyxicephalus adspersus TaxID=30357 RepID=UPI003B5CB7F3